MWRFLRKLIARSFAIPERGNIRSASAITSRSNLSEIIKIRPSRNRPKIGVSFKGAYDLIAGLMEMGLVASFGGDFPQTWGMVYQWVSLGLKRAGSPSLEIPVFTPEEPPPVILYRIGNLNASARRSLLLRNFEYLTLEFRTGKMSLVS